jgi:hypothetical protein
LIPGTVSIDRCDDSGSLAYGQRRVSQSKALLQRTVHDAGWGRRRNRRRARTGRSIGAQRIASSTQEHTRKYGKERDASPAGPQSVLDLRFQIESPVARPGPERIPPAWIDSAPKPISGGYSRERLHLSSYARTAKLPPGVTRCLRTKYRPGPSEKPSNFDPRQANTTLSGPPLRPHGKMPLTRVLGSREFPRDSLTRAISPDPIRDSDTPHSSLR